MTRTYGGVAGGAGDRFSYADAGAPLHVPTGETAGPTLVLNGLPALVTWASARERVLARSANRRVSRTGRNQTPARTTIVGAVRASNWSLVTIS